MENFRPQQLRQTGGAVMRQNKTKAERVKKVIRNYLMISAAMVLFGVGVSLFLDPNNLAPGGVSGIAIILNRITGLETGTWNLVINIPIMLLGLWKFGWRFIVSTVYATALGSWFINLFAPYGPVTTDPLLAALAGGFCMAVSLGIVFKAGATTGGMDIIVKILRLRYKHMKTGTLYLMVDILVVIASAFVFKDLNVALYAMISVIITGWVFDQVLYGKDEAKMIIVISDNATAIAHRIMEELDIGVTYLKGRGAYSENEKRVILCVMKNTLSPKAEEIIREEDPNVFMIVARASEIYGEGHKNIFSEKL